MVEGLLGKVGDIYGALVAEAASSRLGEVGVQKDDVYGPLTGREGGGVRKGRERGLERGETRNRARRGEESSERGVGVGSIVGSGGGGGKRNKGRGGDAG